jgi:hypothetical protein
LEQEYPDYRKLREGLAKVRKEITTQTKLGYLAKAIGS